MPAYDRNTLSRECEVSWREPFPGNSGTNPALISQQSLADRGSNDDDVYRGERYDDATFFGTRRRNEALYHPHSLT
ncbi:hypothetical protein [Gemmatimonas sp.]|uniref:hypothetical protein n=1 Tax=Gemmatimonas sp. TaxID=1962908 RepID=UPI0037C03871